VQPEQHDHQQRLQGLAGEAQRRRFQDLVVPGVQACRTWGSASSARAVACPASLRAGTAACPASSRAGAAAAVGAALVRAIVVGALESAGTSTHGAVLEVTALESAGTASALRALTSAGTCVRW
jgi:hypothetical protein